MGVDRGVRTTLTCRVFLDMEQVVVKEHVSLSAAADEEDWYRALPWACPRLVARFGRTLVVERLPTALELLGEWADPEGLRTLLERLHERGVHHRDVHLGNVVRGSDGRPLLIDWETAVHAPGEPSYDLVGPGGTGVPPPDLQEPGHYHWWGCGGRIGISQAWGG